LLIPLAVVIGVVSAFTGNWPVVGLMAIVVALQAVNLFVSRRRPGRPDNRDSG
jgi:hypothetical protein